MVRVKGGIQTRQNHKKTLDLAKGYWMTRHKQIKKAKEAVLHAGAYSFAGRKAKKRDFRKLWITRLNAAVRTYDISYSQFIHLLKTKNIGIDRKILAQIAVDHPKIFETFVSQIKA
jgi:large subunit ribosomal protein L20